VIVDYPFVSEKATIVLEEQGKLHVMVDVRATKDDIRRAVEQMYEFKVKYRGVLIWVIG